jgi:hypothetical protein
LHFLHLNANYIDINAFQIDKLFDSNIQLRIFQKPQNSIHYYYDSIAFLQFFCSNINNILKMQQHKQKQPITQLLQKTTIPRAETEQYNAINNFQNPYSQFIYSIHI